MTTPYGKSMRAGDDGPWYHNPLAFFGLTFLSVFLAGYLACVAAFFTAYQVSKGVLERKVDEMKHKLDDWEGLPVRPGGKTPGT